MRHLTLQQLSATVDQALSGVSLELVRRHLEECEECRNRGSKLARVDGVVAQIVSHDPGDAWLEAVVVEIDERVRAEVAGRFDPPAHPAGPPPLESFVAPPALSPDELEKVWEEGSTTPRPSTAKPHEPAAQPAQVPAKPAQAPANDAAPLPALPSFSDIEQAAKTASPNRSPVAGPLTVKPAPPLREPAAKETSNASPPKSGPSTSRPAEVRTPVPAAPPRGNEVLAPAATTRIPPLRRRAEGEEEPPMRWGRHADRVVRARREAASAERETFLPLAFGLVGGALAGALVVTLFFLRHGGAGTAPAAPVVHSEPSPAPVAAVEDPVARPELEPVPAPAVTPPTASATRSGEVTAAVVPPPPAAPVKPRATPPATTPSAPAPRARTESGAAGARAIPTGEESWPLLCGEVVDESGAPVLGARILLADLDVGARTDRRGRFCLAAPPGDRTLSVVALGFTTQRRAVSVANGAPEVHLVLKAAP